MTNNTRLLLASLAIAGLLAITVNGGAGGAQAAEAHAIQMKRYKNLEWRFELDVPKDWSVMPAAIGQGEIARFMSIENGKHLVLVSRHLLKPGQTPAAVVDQNQKYLGQKGYAHFVRGETTLGPNRVLTLDFDTVTPEGQAWYCRHYYVIKGSVGYLLSFGTSDRDGMFEVYDRMAKSFAFADL